MAATDVLDNLQSNAQDDGVTIDDVNSYAVKQLSPEQQQAFNDQNPSYTATGSLNSADYYPGMNRPLGVGNYSGSVVGSNTIYAAQPALVPYGIFDAREKAIQDAALSKVKEVEAYKKAFKAPTSKLVNINPELTKQYTSFLDDSWNKALKAAGGNGVKAKAMLQNDPEFSRREKSYQDLAKYGDEIVNKWAKDDEDIKTGKFTPTPAYKEAKRKMLTALDPSSKEFSDIGNTFRTMKVERDFSDAYNKIVDKMVQNQTASAGMDPNDPEFIKIRETTVKSWSPEQKAAVAEQMKNIYQSSDYFTPSKIDSDLKTMMAGEVKTSNLEVKERRDEGGLNEKFTEENDAKEPSLTNVAFQVKAGTGAGGSDYTNEQVAGHFGQTLKKPIPVQVASGTRMYSIGPDGKMFIDNKSKGVRDVKIGKAENVQVIDAPGTLDHGRVITPQYLKRNPNVKTKFEPMAKGSYEKEVIATEEDVRDGNASKVGETMRGSSGKALTEEVSVYIPLSEVESGVQKKSNGKYIGGINVDLMNKRSSQLNSGEIKADQINVQKNTAGENVAVKGAKAEEANKTQATEKPKARKYKGLDKAGNPIFE